MVSLVRNMWSVEASIEPAPFHSGMLKFNLNWFAQFTFCFMFQCNSVANSPLKHCPCARTEQTHPKTTNTTRFINLNISFLTIFPKATAYDS